MIIERYSLRLATGSLLAAAGLLISSCSSRPTESPAQSSGDISDQKSTNNVATEVTYYPDGAATVIISGTDVKGYSGEEAEIYEFCQGTMFVAEATEPSPNGPTFIPDARACQDGKLTAQDFALKPQLASASPTQ